jgi:hypothetical protein
MGSKLYEKTKSIFLSNFVLAVVIILYLIFQLILILGFKQLPSPIFGGDYYHSMGSINNIRYGGDVLGAPNVLGSEPQYLPLYSIFVAVIANLFNLSTFHAMGLASVLIMIFAMFIVYFLSIALFSSKHIGVISVLIYLPLTKFPIWKYLDFTLTLMFPLFLLLLFRFWKNRKMLNAILAGIAYGLIGWSHTVGFVSANIVLVFASLSMLFFRYFSVEKTKILFMKSDCLANFRKTAIKIAVIFAIGVLVALPIWFKPIFVYHGDTKNPVQDYTQYNFDDVKYMFVFLFNTIKENFFNFGNLFSAGISVLFLAGVVLFFVARRKQGRSDELRFISVVLVSAFAGSFHYFLMQPILGTNLSAPYIAKFLFPISQMLFASFAIMYSCAIPFVQKHVKKIIYAVIIVLFIVTLLNFASFQQTNQYVAMAKTELPALFPSMQSWILNNTDVNDVFLSSNELSFALNGLTGRKEVVGRRSHNSLYINLDERQADAAVMLYGNDDAKREELLKKYNAKYMFWAFFWLSNDFSFGENGTLVGISDPLIVLDKKEYRDMFEKYNISYLPQHTWLDPSMRGEQYKQYDLLIVMPSQFDIAHPWHSKLDKYLKSVWEYKEDSQTLAAIYRIDVK